ncbi:hypothetical protein D3C87_1883700 [compost metagenome]
MTGACAIPLRVVTRTTPLAALTPYTAVADASLSIETDSTSSTEISDISRSTPSTKMSGERFAPKVDTPLIHKLPPSLPNSPLR